MTINQTFYYYFLVIILFFNNINVFGQDISVSKIDSLKLVLMKDNVKDIDKINSYLELTKIFIHKNIDSSIFYVEKGKLLAENSNNSRMVAVFLIEFARIKEVQNDFEASLDYLNEAAKLYEGLDKDNTYITVCNYQGMYYEMLSNYDMSIEKYLLGLKLSRDLNNRMYEAVFLENLSLVYARANKFKNSLASSLESADIYNEIGSRDQYFMAIMNVGNSYIKLRKYVLAKEHLNKAKIHFTKINDHILLADIYSNLGEIEALNKNWTGALEIMLIARSHALTMREYNGEQNYKLALINNKLGEIYMHFKNYSLAIEMFNESEKIGVKLKSLEVLKDSYKGLYVSYLKLKKLDSVQHYLNLYTPTSDNFMAERYNLKIDQLNYEYQLDKERFFFKKEKDIINAQKENQKLYYISTLSILALIILVIFIFFYILKVKYIKSNLLSKNLKLEKENLSLGLERKNKELTKTLLNLIERNEFISDISEKLEGIKSIENLDDRKNIQSILRDIDKNISKKLWKEFELSYIEVHKDFFERLNKKHKNLTSNDKRLCALIILNMSTKEISAITYQSEQSIKIARYRMRKKLGISKNENLNAFLSQI